MSDTYAQDNEAKSVLGFIEGLNILSKYMKNQRSTKYFCGAEHDVLYIYTEEERTPSEDSSEGIRLSELGFHMEGDGWAYFT